MFKLIVIGKNGKEESDFATQAEAQAHFDSIRLTGHWGAEEYIVNHEEIIAQDEVLDQDGNIVTSAIVVVRAWVETIPAQFTYEIISVTQPLADISPRQIALALLSMGITETQVIAAINQLSSPLKEQGIIAWNRSNYFVRTEPAVAMIGALMNLSSEQVDNIWTIGISL